MNKAIGAQDISKEEIQEVAETLESGWLFKISKVQQFEKEFAARHLYVLQVDKKQADSTRSVHFIPVHIHPYDQKRFGFKEADLPIAMNDYKGTLSLPLSIKVGRRCTGCH
ncbi:hypothetical protein BCV50_14585 [Bacillus subtilis]|nr:hypothetical protein BCV50_14585 [Bacillus subtilis]